ncbi:MAG: thioredoxin [Acidobacteriota bacterium]
MAEAGIHVTDETFEDEVLKSEIPVLVDFWAEWCAPCKMVEPVLLKLQDSLQGRLKIVKCNVDKNHKIPAKYGIMSIPTFLLFKRGELKDSLVGAVPQEKILEVISKHL